MPALESDAPLDIRASRALAETDRLVTHSALLRARNRHLISTVRAAHQTLSASRVTFVRRRVTFITSHRARLPRIVGRVLDAVNVNLAQWQTLADLGRLLECSPWHLNVAFQRGSGITIHEYTMSLRMERAAVAIREGVKIEAIACSLGYRSRKTFYRQFSLSFDMSPGEYRASQLSRLPALPADIRIRPR
jgi:AraC-like DNA-binding protein